MNYTHSCLIFFYGLHVLWKTCVNLSKIASCCWWVYHFSLANTCVFYFHNVWFNFILYWILHRSQSLVTRCLIFSDSKKTEHLERLILGASSWWNGAKRCQLCFAFSKWHKSSSLWVWVMSCCFNLCLLLNWSNPYFAVEIPTVLLLWTPCYLLSTYWIVGEIHIWLGKSWYKTFLGLNAMEPPLLLNKAKQNLHFCIYIYICIYIFIHTYIYLYTYTHIYI